MPLAALFRGRARAGIHPELTDELLEAELAALVQRGRARWPGLSLDEAELAAAAGARAQPDQALSALHAEDLWLALSCENRIPGALEAFEQHSLSTRPLGAALKRIDPSPAFVDEVRQRGREKLFVPPPGRIAEYSGRGSLAAWTRGVAMRVALDLRPHLREGPEGGDGERAAERDPELRYLQQKYRGQFEEAMAAAVSSLDPEQANLLRLQIVEGLGTAQIAALFQVDRSTIKRRLAACRETLLDQTRAALRDKRGLSP